MSSCAIECLVVAWLRGESRVWNGKLLQRRCLYPRSRHKCGRSLVAGTVRVNRKRLDEARDCVEW